MAKTTLNGHVLNSGPVTYTVPASKYAILQCIGVVIGNLQVNGVNLASLAAGAVVKPVVLGAGDVLGINGGSADAGYTGFLFDA